MPTNRSMLNVRRLRPILAALSVAAALTSFPPAALAGSEGEGTATALDGNGVWIWYVSASGGTASNIARMASDHGISTVLVKSSDADDYWSQFSRELVDGLHGEGIQVCAWQFVYGSVPREEARMGARAVRKGADCLVIDAEGHYEGRYAAADRYIRKLRARIGHDYPLALASFPYVDFHPAFPYSVFLGRGGAQLNVPQMYWRAIGVSVRTIYSHAYRWNRPYDRPIYPLGQTYQDPPRRQIVLFRRLATEYGAGGVSWWSWQETGGREWDWVGMPLTGGVSGFEPDQSYARLRVGSAGDLVVHAQARLRAARHDVQVDGQYGAGTARAVSLFQVEHALRATGNIGTRTWRELVEYQPVRVRWSQRASAARIAGRALGRPSGPDSASLPAVRDEIPPPSERR